MDTGQRGRLEQLVQDCGLEAVTATLNEIAMQKACQSRPGDVSNPPTVDKGDDLQNS